MIPAAAPASRKVLPPSNSWVSKSKNSSGQWVYWLNLLDTAKSLAQNYTLTFTNPVQNNRSPVIVLPQGRYYLISPGRALSIPVTVGYTGNTLLASPINCC